MTRPLQTKRSILPIGLVWIVCFLVACSQVFPSLPTTGIIPTRTTIPPATRPGTTASPVPATAKPTEPAARINLKAEELRSVIIHFWPYWSGPGGEVIKSLVDDFNLHNQWGIVVVPVYQPTLEDLENNLSTAILAGNPPDLVEGSPHQILAWEASKELVDLRSYVEDPVWGLTPQDQADFYPVFWGQEIVDGQRFGIPAQGSGQLLFYNTTWARELGFSAPPVSTKDFAEQACTAAHANQAEPGQENKGTGGWIVSTDYSAMLGWVYASGGDILKTPGTGVSQSIYQFDTPQTEETFTFLRRLFDAGCAWMPDNQVPTTDFASRRGLFATGSLTDIPYQNEAFKQAGNSDEWTVLPFPSTSTKPAIDVYGSSFAVLSSTPQRQLAAWLLIKWLTNPENQARLVEATGALPLRASTLNLLADYKTNNPQWAAATGLLSLAHTEPPFQSWDTVRWAFGDASTQLFRSYFTIDQVPILLVYLDQTAADLHSRANPGGILNANPPTPLPGFTLNTQPASTPTIKP